MNLREIFIPPIRAGVWTVLIVGAIFLIVDPPSLSGLGDLVSAIVGVALILFVTAWAVVVLTGDEIPEADFRKLMDRSEAIAAMPAPEREPTEFDQMVIEALDELPDEFQAVLRDIPVIVSNHGHEYRAYGHYIGDTVARNNHLDRIVIYEDTLVRDFGFHPEVLRAQVKRTVRHEVAHHLGWDEPGVRNLGL